MHKASVWHPVVHCADVLQENGQIPGGLAIHSAGALPAEASVRRVAWSTVAGAAAAG